MNKIFAQYWWKILGMVLLCFVFLGGLLIPLSPGILTVNPDTVQVGQQEVLSIEGYNTEFLKATDDVKVWLKLKDHYILSDDVKVLDNQHLQATVLLPYTLGEEDLSNQTMDVVVSDDCNGTISQRNALVIGVNNREPLDIKEKACNPPIIQKSTLFGFPNREILNESIRNLFFHVPMWFCMVSLLMFSFIAAIMYLMKGDIKYDIYSSAAAQAGLLFGTLGILTGMLWANYTWGAPWPNDPKLNGAAIAMMIYIAYAILRGSVNDPIRKAKISAVYNIFAYVIYIAFIFVYPRLTDSLHPGNGGNPAFSNYDLDSSMRLFFYPAVIAWTILGFWLVSLKIRYKFALQNFEESEN